MQTSAPSINFNPALVLQRQEFLLESLRELEPKSVLDVGCGEGRILDCLVRCDDALPVEILVGLDISLPILQSAAAPIQATANDQQDDGRWRPLDVTLLQGRFAQLESATGGSFDAVVSSEVIEHLDPPDLDKYWDIHLGKLKPNKLIVTTPNREFNLIFETVEQLGRTPGRSYAREGLDYRVRHDDHRFEYTRAEFQDDKAAARFGYDVTFTGVGTAHNALNQFPELVDQYQFTKVGYCSQIAVFTRPSLVPNSTPISPAWTWGDLQVVSHFHYPCNVFTEYPPLPETVATSLGSMWRQFRPEYNSLNTRSGFIASPVARIFGGIYFEGEEVLACKVAIDKLWDLNYAVEKLCRFHKDVFLLVGEQLDGKSFDREFEGLEVGGGTLRSFRFAKVDAEMFILYEYSRDVRKVVRLVN